MRHALAAHPGAADRADAHRFSRCRVSPLVFLVPMSAVAVLTTPRQRTRQRAHRRGSAGRAPYTLEDVGGRAIAGMRAAPVAKAPARDTSRAAWPPRPAPACDMHAKLSTSPEDAAAVAPTPLCPVFVEGLGRVVVHVASLGSHDAAAAATMVRRTPPTPPPSAAAGPSRTSPSALAFQQRRALIEQWLASDDELPADDACAPALHHPLVAAHLCARNRHARLKQQQHPTQRHQNTDTGAPRRIATMSSLVAAGLSPVMGCHCGFTDAHMDMAQCEACRRWLHLACVGVCSARQLPAEWMCDECYDQTAAIAHSPAMARGEPLHAHVSLRTLSLAPSPQRPRHVNSSSQASPLWSRHFSSNDTVPTSPLACDVEPFSDDIARCTPSPPPALRDVITPSRHVPSAAMASTSRAAPHEWPATPSRFLLGTPGSGSTRLFSTRTRTPAAPDSPTSMTRAVRFAAPSTPGDATPSFRSDDLPESLRLSSPTPATPTGLAVSARSPKGLGVYTPSLVPWME